MLKKLCVIVLSLCVLLTMGTAALAATTNDYASAILLFFAGCSNHLEGDAPISTQDDLYFSVGDCLLIPPKDHVITYELDNVGYLLSKNGVEHGWINYETSAVPFSEQLLECPELSMLSWYGGVHQVVHECRSISLNDGWVCYLYKGETNSNSPENDFSGAYGILYGALIGQVGESGMFSLVWQNYSHTPSGNELIPLSESEPGFATDDDIVSFLEGITVQVA